MRVSAELKGRRLFAALVLLALLPSLLAVAAFASQPPASTPGPPAYDPLPLDKTPLLEALWVGELQRTRRLTRAAVGQAAPFLAQPVFPERVPTIVLVQREAPYALAELQQRFPQAFGRVDDAPLLTSSLQVLAGASLQLDSRETPALRLASSPEGFTTIIATRGAIGLTGTADRPVTVSSWDTARGAVDDDASDGRSFLLTLGGRMDLAYADVGHLGFGTGSSSGLAWRGEPEGDGLPVARAQGDVSSSTLHNNRFGAFTFEAQGMRWSDNAFVDNDAYGFDPHDLSNDFVVERNVAHGNGRHGFIFSRGCDRNVLRNNVAFDNRGHGFMIDDGRSEDSLTAEARLLPSNDNQLLDNWAYDNDGSGIELEGGSGLLVRGNTLERNHVGIRVKDQASATVEGNTALDNRLAGVDVLAGAGDVLVDGNRVRGGWAGITLGDTARTRLVANGVGDTSTPLVVGGVSQRRETLAGTISQFYRWNPVLVLWTAILGVPVLVGLFGPLRRLARRRGPRMRPSILGVPVLIGWVGRGRHRQPGLLGRLARRRGPRMRPAT